MLDTYGKTIPVLIPHPERKSKSRLRRNKRESPIQYRHPEITPGIEKVAQTVKRHARRHGFYLGDFPVNNPPPRGSAPEIVFSPREIYTLLNPKHGKRLTEIHTPGGGILRTRARGAYIPVREFYRLLKLLELFGIVTPIARDKNPGRTNARLYRKEQLYLIARLIRWEANNRERGRYPAHLWRFVRYPLRVHRTFSIRLRVKEKSLKKIQETAEMT